MSLEWHQPIHFCGPSLQNNSWVNQTFGVLQQECFLDALRMVPHMVFTLIALPILIALTKSYAHNYHRKTWIHFPHHNFRWILTVVLVIVNVFQVSEGFLSDARFKHNHLHLFVPYLLNLLGTYMAIAYYHNSEVWNSPRLLLVCFPYWGTCVCVDVMKVVCLMEYKDQDESCVRLQLCRISAGLYVLLLLIEVDVFRQLRYALVKKGKKSITPADELADIKYDYRYVSLVSKATYFFMVHLFYKGYRGVLKVGDLGQLPQSECSKVMFRKLIIPLQNKYKKSTPGKVHISLWRCYWQACWPMMMLAGGLRLLGDLLHLVAPVCLPFIVHFVEASAASTNSSSTPLKSFDGEQEQAVGLQEFFLNGYVLLMVAVIASLLSAAFLQAHCYLVVREGIRLRGALQILVYNKMLCLSEWEFSSHQLSPAKLISLITADANSLFYLFYISHSLWAVPLKSVLVLLLLYHTLGWAGLVAGGVGLLLWPVHYGVTQALATVRKASVVSEERHLVVCGEMFQAIKLLKLFAWERLFCDKLLDTRQEQLRFLLKAACLKAVSVFITEGSPILVPLVAFTLFPYLDDRSLTPARAFTSLVLFDLLGQPLMQFPQMVSFCRNARASTARLESLLGAREVERAVMTLIEPVPKKVSVTFGLTPNGLGDTDDSRGFSSLPRRPGATPDMGQVLPPGLGVITEEGEDKLSQCSAEGGVNAKLLGGSEKPHDDLHLHRHVNPVDGSLLPSGTLPTQGGAVKSSSPNRSPCCSPNPSARPYPGGSPLKQPSAGMSPQLSPSASPLLPTRRLPSSPLRSALRPAQRQSPRASPTTSRESTPVRFPAGAMATGPDAQAGWLRKRPSAGAISLGGSGLDDADIDSERGIGVAVEITDGCFSWDPHKGKDPQLRNIDFRANAGQLTMVTGPKEGGKSCLLAAILGEMTTHSGTVVWRSGVTACYVAQTPWVRSTSVQDNILQGSRMDKHRYRRVLHACALNSDLNILPAGDQTSIGEKGLGLSIGQHQRVCLARAMYSKADVVIVDGALDCLDVHSGAHVFEDGVLKFLLRRRRTVILVSEHVHYLPYAEMIYRLEDGQISHAASFLDIKLHDPDLFAEWQDLVRKARVESEVIKTEGEEARDGTAEERRNLQRRISTMEFQRDFGQQLVLSEGKPADSGVAGGNDLLMTQESYGSSSSSKTTMMALEKLIQDQHRHELDDPDDLETAEGAGGMMSSGRGGEDGGQEDVGITWPAFRAWAWAFSIILTVVMVTGQLARAGLVAATDFWLARWANADMVSQPMGNATQPSEVSTLYYLSRYGLLAAGAIALALVLAFVSESSGWRAGRTLHKDMLINIAHAPMRFFDTTPVSVIMSRFSGDVSAVDDKMATSLSYLSRTTLLVVVVLTVNSIISLYFLIPAAAIISTLFILQKFFRSISRQLQQLDSLTKGPIVTLASETLTGLSTIRAFRNEEKFQQEMVEHVNTNNLVYLWLHTAIRFLAVRLDALGALTVFCAGLTGITAGVYGQVSSGLVALGIAYALMFGGYLSWMLRSLVEVEMQMNAVGRLSHLANVPHERSDPHLDMHIPVSWPEMGELTFQNVWLTYDPSLEPVVRGLNLFVAPGAKVGLCGRTGCGKSSLALGLFRLLDLCEGHIFIDSTDIQHLPLEVLRARLAIVPQDPQLFSAPLRYNLDPKGRRSDDELWSMLSQVRMKDRVKFLPAQLDYQLVDCGVDFSMEEKQLLCLARALLKDTRVLVLDEVVAGLDAETERVVHEVIRSTCSNKTLIIIANRGSTLLQCDTVAVMDQGVVVEQDTPSNLLQMEGGTFASLIKGVS